MEITQVKIFPVEEDKLKAFVSVVFDHCFMVNDIKVIQGRDGLFISMPSRRKRNGRNSDRDIGDTAGQVIELLRLRDGGRDEDEPVDRERHRAANREDRNAVDARTTVAARPGHEGAEQDGNDDAVVNL